MKKYILFILMTLFLSSCFFGNKQENNNYNNDNSFVNTGTSNKQVVVNTGSNLAITGSSSKSEDNENIVSGIYAMPVPKKVDSFKKDLLLFQYMIQNDEDFFKKEKELDYFYVNRNFIFGDKYTYQNVSDLVKCLKGEIPYTSVKGDYSLICKGDDKYISESDTNFYHIKDTLINFNKIANGGALNCNYFLSKNYDYPIDKKIFSKVNDYFSCMKLSDKSYDLKAEYYYFSIAVTLNKCSELKDLNLVKLCQENVTISSKNTKN